MKIESYYIKKTLIIAIFGFLCVLILVFTTKKWEENKQLIEVSGVLEYSPIIKEVDNNYYIDLKLKTNPNIFRVDNDGIINNDSLGNQITALTKNTWIQIKIRDFDKDAKYHRITARPEVLFLGTKDKVIFDQDIIDITKRYDMVLLVIAFFILIVVFTVFNKNGWSNSDTEERFIYRQGQYTKFINESISWSGSPKLVPFIFSEYLLLLVIFYGIGFFYLFQFSHRVWGFYPDMIVAYVSMAALPVGVIIRAIVGCKTKYLITEKHLYIVTSVLFDNVQKLDKEKISGKYQKSNLVEELFDVTTVRFYTGKKGEENEKIYDKFRCINEYENIDFGI